MGIEDPHLAIVVDLVLDSEKTNRPLYTNPIKEPVLFRRYVKKWILSGFKELELARKKERKKEQ